MEQARFNLERDVVGLARVAVKPEVLRWARERAGLESVFLSRRFPKLRDWEQGTVQPTLRQLEEYAQAVHLPIGYLFLSVPPDLQLPIPDLRTLAGRIDTRPSLNLLDTVYMCQQRQDWFVEYAHLHGLTPLSFIQSVSPQEDPVAVAGSIARTLGLSTEARMRLPTWAEALRYLKQKAEDVGILVMASSIVGSNTRRKLDVAEFRGFALADRFAPVIFLNAADSKSAQMFTLCHELAHLWIGESGVSDPVAGAVPAQPIERWCNAIAAEVLVPVEELHGRRRPDLPLEEEVQHLARVFKVSLLVILRRLLDVGAIDQDTYWQAYYAEAERILSYERGGGSGGDFYRTLAARTGKLFARAVISSTLEGQTLFRDSFRMLGIRKTATFYEAARELGVML